MTLMKRFADLAYWLCMAGLLVTMLLSQWHAVDPTPEACEFTYYMLQCSALFAAGLAVSILTLVVKGWR